MRAGRHKLCEPSRTMEGRQADGTNKGPPDNKQERGQMKRKGAEGLAAGTPVIPAANEEFTETAESLERLAYTRAGWDPYEVWRTRVKATSRARQEHERDPLR